ncbi:unnamed protein product [Acanthoscelides obtectus]|uniref:Uncharacterized protein n=2 Tax=Acanthoscelides obtectus TaxID=200917 RepID=A0A9P0KDG8_ACAOB|nr:unnamed protein product [Acanthoscelides obtectus]CAK1652031.1 Rac-like GTP-binding protein 1 [Acanthoscelides obtectus]
MATASKRTIRITVVGDGATGKTCLLIAYKDKRFDERYVPTVFDVYSMTIPINGLEYTVVLSDTAGQEEFDKLRRFAYKDVDCFILTYSVDERTSYENVSSKWIPELRKFAPKAKIILAGTKKDLKRDDPNHITTQEGEDLAQFIGANGFVENSSKSMSFVDATFQMAITSVIQNKNFLNVNRQTRDCCTCV